MQKTAMLMLYYDGFHGSDGCLWSKASRRAAGERAPQPGGIGSSYRLISHGNRGTAQADGRDRILRGYTVEIDRETLGLEVMAFIRMSCGGQQYNRLLDYVQTLEEVRECHHLTGGDDLLLKVTTTSMADLEALIEALLPFGNPVTSLVLSSPVEHRRYAVTGKLVTVTKKHARRR